MIATTWFTPEESFHLVILGGLGLAALVLWLVGHWLFPKGKVLPACPKCGSPCYYFEPVLSSHWYRCAACGWIDW